MEGKGFVLEKVNSIWELIPDDQWDQLRDRMPEDIRLMWGKYMNPGD
jgi:hypothetical protein